MLPRTLSLTEAERIALVHTRDRDPRPYLRDRAKALLLIADGGKVPTLCTLGILSTKRRETVYGWLNAFQQSRTLEPHQPRRKRLSPPGSRARKPAGEHPPPKS